MLYLDKININQLALLSGKSYNVPYPLAVRLQLTSYCNMNCIMCPCSFHNQQHLNISPQCLEKVVSVCKGKVNTIGISYLGEPTLHPDFWEIIDYLTQISDWNIGLQTNGTTLNDDFIGKLLKSKLDSISISIDTFDYKRYNKYRPGANYQILIKNIEKILKLKLKLRPDFIVILRVFSDEIKRMTPKEYYKNVLYWRALGCYAISTGRMFNHAGAITEVEDSCLQCRSKEYPCIFPWYYLVVGVNGECRPCCMDTEGLMTICNINEIDKLEDYWNGPELMAFRQELLDNCPTNKLCKSCNWRQLVSPEDLFH